MKKPWSLAALLMVPGVASAAVSIPYSNPFDSNDGQFSASPSGQWALSSGSYVNNNPLVGGTSSATVEVTGRPATEAFRMTTTFTLADTSNSFSIGFMFLSSAADTSGTYYFADVITDGTLRLFQVTAAGGGATSIASSSSGGTLGALNTSETMTMTLTGTYTGSSLNISYSVSDGTNTRTLTATSAISSPLSGNYFGYRNRNNTTTSGTDPYIANFNDFSITVPEPASAALAGLGMLVLLKRRR